MKLGWMGALALLVVTACDSGSKPDAQKDDAKQEATGEGKGEPGATKEASDKPAEAEGGTKETKIEQLGIKADLPSDAQVTDGIGGKGVMIMGLTAPVNVSLAADDKPKTLDAAKKDAEMFKPKNVQEEKLSDGWILTFENEGSMGTNYWLVSRRELGGKAYSCDTSVAHAKQRDAAIKVCKSLRP